MPTLGVCSDSVLATNGPLALINFFEATSDKNRLDDSAPKGTNRKRRSHKRAIFDYRLLIRPLEENHREDQTAVLTDDLSEAYYVIGKDLSEVGLGIFHREPLPFRRARLEAADERLEAMGLGDMTFELTIRWCRFISEQRYESGCRVWWPG